jgi:murein endopeptidase
VLYTVAQRWKAAHPKGWIYLGDMNAAGHKSHRWGVAADLEATTNGTDWVADMTKPSYNRAATIELGKMFVDTGKLKNIWYNDTAVDQAVIAYAQSMHLPLTQMMPISGHDNHFHVDVTTPRGPQYEPGC